MKMNIRALLVSFIAGGDWFFLRIHAATIPTEMISENSKLCFEFQKTLGLFIAHFGTFKLDTALGSFFLS